MCEIKVEKYIHNFTEDNVAECVLDIQVVLFAVVLECTDICLRSYSEIAKSFTHSITAIYSCTIIDVPTLHKHLL